MMKKKIISNIKHFREVNNFTQEYVAGNIGLSISGYSKIERGATEITVSQLEKIAMVLQVPVEKLITFDRVAYLTSLPVEKAKTETTIENTHAEISRLKSEIDFIRSMLLEKK